MKKERFNYRWRKQTKNQNTIHKKDSQTAEEKKSGQSRETLVITEVRQWVRKQAFSKSLKERDAVRTREVAQVETISIQIIVWTIIKARKKKEGKVKQ